ncbi:MAG: DegT/DnrJ/EryC1/StrS family aminotransferase [Candidatus Eisenbacteria bacterium]|nr:DegT/DnrJ/EryC1/StrS family aminotransferase [Candidatus Eisenbacteria bacterium]
MSERIPLVDLRAQYQSIRAEMDEAIGRVVSRCAFILGEEAEAFEAEFASFVGTSHCIGVGNGTDALTLALQALGIGSGDEVITVSLTFIATAEAISALGAIPVFVDVAPDTLLMDVAAVERAITPRTRAIIPVHLYGQVVDMDPLLELAAKASIPVVEDAAQAHGATYRGRRAGSMGRLAAFSFYPGKNLGAYGDAGAVVTADPELARWVRKARDHGRTSKYAHDFVGRNSRLDGIQAAVLRCKLRHLEGWNAARRALAAEYDRRLAAVGGVRRVVRRADGDSACHLYVVEVDGRDEVVARLRGAGIEAGAHYPIPVHRQGAYSHIEGVALPVTEAAADRVLSLPLYPELSADAAARVTGAIAATVCASDR